MKKFALVLVVAIFAPSLALAWLAVRSLHDQQFILERQRALLHQGIADGLAQDVNNYMLDVQLEFGRQVSELISSRGANATAQSFDQLLLGSWSLAEVGFAVLEQKGLLAPKSGGRQAAQAFLRDNEFFLTGGEKAEVYAANVQPQTQATAPLEETASYDAGGFFAQALDSLESDEVARDKNQRLQPQDASQVAEAENEVAAFADEAKDNKLDAPAGAVMANSPTLEQFAASPPQRQLADPQPAIAIAGEAKKSKLAKRPASRQVAQDDRDRSETRFRSVSKKEIAQQKEKKGKGEKISLSSILSSREDSPAQLRKVLPSKSSHEEVEQISRIISTQAEFQELASTASEGLVARFFGNRLVILLWLRVPEAPEYVFGAQLNMERLSEELSRLLYLEYELKTEVCLALLDHAAQPVGLSHKRFETDWRRPFVATEIGEALPYWEAAIYLLDPGRITRSAEMLKFTLGMMILLLVMIIALGIWLVVQDLSRHMRAGAAEDRLRQQRLPRAQNAPHLHPHVLRASGRRASQGRTQTPLLSEHHRFRIRSPDSLDQQRARLLQDGAGAKSATSSKPAT